MLASRLFLSFLILAPSSFAGDVHVVARGGPGTLPDVQAALDISKHGDVVLVYSGTYAGFTIGDLEVSVVAAPQHDVTVGGITISPPVAN